MGNRDIKKEVKKKKTTSKPAAAAPKAFVPQPDLVKKPKKEKESE